MTRLPENYPWVEWMAWQVALAEYQQSDGTWEHVPAAASAFLDALAASKKASTAPAERIVACRGCGKERTLGAAVCLMCGDRTWRDPATPTPEPSGRTCEELIREIGYLSGWATSTSQDERVELALAAHRSEVSALKAERDAWCDRHVIVTGAYNKACAANERLEAERDIGKEEIESLLGERDEAIRARDELKARIERARAQGISDFPYEPTMKALEGRE